MVGIRCRPNLMHLSDDRHGAGDHLIIYSRECYPDFQPRKYRVSSMELNTLFASLPCLNQSEIFSAIKRACLRTADDRRVLRSPKWLINEVCVLIVDLTLSYPLMCHSFSITENLGFLQRGRLLNLSLQHMHWTFWIGLTVIHVRSLTSQSVGYLRTGYGI